MIEELYYLDEGYLKISAASVGISSKRWSAVPEAESSKENCQFIMRQGRFDILPIITANLNTLEYFTTDLPNNYENISRQKITYKDVIPLDTSIREIIKGFILEQRTFYFLTYHSQITGLITIGNLNCRQVQVYIFGLICELERFLSNFINSSLAYEIIKQYIIAKSENNPKLKEIIENYNKLVDINLENNLLEHLYFCDFLNIIREFELYNQITYSKPEWKKLNGINKLRNLIAHPTRSLLNEDYNIFNLWEDLNKIDDLLFRLNIWSKTNVNY